jgi:hypothetical protein
MKGIGKMVDWRRRRWKPAVPGLDLLFSAAGEACLVLAPHAPPGRRRNHAAGALALLTLAAFLSLTLAAQSPQEPAPRGVGGDTPSEAQTLKPVGQEDAATPPAVRSPEMQVSRTDAGAGENERNENVAVNPVDMNLLKDLLQRLGTTATLIPQFLPDLNYLGSEYGVAPTIGLHPSARVWRGVHGRVYESHQNSVFGARAFFQVGGLKPAHDNQYGVAVEAPVWRGAFISLDMGQQKTRGMVNGNVLVPLPSERTPLATDPALRAFVLLILNAYPNEVPNRTDIDPRMLNTNSPRRVDGQDWNTRFDQQIGSRDRLVFQYHLIDQKVIAFQLVAGQNPDSTSWVNDGRVTWHHDWTPATSISATIGLVRTTSLLVPSKDNLGPSIAVVGLQGLGPTPDIPAYRADNLFRNGMQLRHTHGNHTFVFGFEVARRQYNGFRSDSSRPYINFVATANNSAITNLRLGLPYSMVEDIGNLSAGFRSWDMQYYAGDTWHAAANLTVSYGLRYQPSPAPNEVNHPGVIPYKCDCNNLAPQVGVAYRLPGAAGVLRAGYGLQYGPILASTYAWIRSNPPANTVQAIQQPDLILALTAAAGTSFSGASQGRQFYTLLDPHLVLPYSDQYNFSWERELRGSWHVQLGYVGSDTFKLIQQRSINRGLIGPGMTLSEDTVDARRPDQRYASIRDLWNGSNAWYNAALANLFLPRWRGLHIDVSYWFSKAMDDGSGFADQGPLSQADSQWEYERHKDLRGRSDFDQPQSFRTRVSYETSSLASARRWVRALAGGWNISTIGLLKSGTPFSVFSGSDAPGYGNADGTPWDRPMLVNLAALGRTIGNPDTSRQLLPASAFAYITPGMTAGNLGRNVFRKGAIRNVNASVSRRFPVWKEKPLTIRGESINLFNSPQFAAPDNMLVDSSFGAITNTLNNGRSLRLAASFEF